MPVKKFLYCISFIFGICFPVLAQCDYFDNQVECFYLMDGKYKISSQSTNALISPGDTLKFNAVLIGNREYLISFCTIREYYPIYFRIIDKKSGEIIYRNEDDFYSESVGFLMERTRLVQIEVYVLAETKDYSNIIRKKGCIGLLIQSKPSFNLR